jgi:hypothetical protein
MAEPIGVLTLHPANGRQRSPWQLEADRRWPDGPDLTYVIGDGPWATVAWCTALSVILHPTRERARLALARINGGGCGHFCWGDHDLVNLAEPETIDPEAEYLRGPRRSAHLAACYGCRDWSPRAAGAAMRRAARRRRNAA